MSELKGVNAIEYYLKGRALRDQREQQQQEAQLKAQQLEQNWQISERKFNELSAYQKAVVAKQLADLELAKRNERIRVADLISSGKGKFDPNNPGEVIPTAPEDLNKNLAQRAGAVEEAKNAPLVKRQWDMLPGETEKIRQGEGARLPYRLQQAEQAGRIALERQDDNQRFIAEQNQLKIGAANTRASLNRSAKADERKSEVSNIVDTVEPEVRTGILTREDLNKRYNKQDNALIQNQLTARGIRIWGDEERASTNLLPMAQNFLQKLRTLKDHINSFSDPKLAWLDDKTAELNKEIQQDLDAWGRAVKGFKGPITEKDTGRLEGGIPKPLPAGIRSGLSKPQGIREANQRRVENVEDFIQEKFDLITRGMKPEQKEEIRKSFKLESPNERQTKQRSKPKKAGANWKVVN